MSEAGSARMPLVALVLAVVAVAIALAGLLRSEPAGPPEADRAIRLAVETRDAAERLEARVASLEGRLEQLARARRRETTGTGTATGGAGRPGGADEGPGRAARDAPAASSLVDLERRIADLEARASGTGRTQTERPEPFDLRGLARVAEDRTLDAETRVAALRRLRRLAGGRTRAVTLAMIDLYRQNPEPAIRTDIFRQLSGVTEPELMDVLLEALRDDPHHKVREEAIESLGAFDDPRVNDAIRDAAENDPHADVREEAEKRLRFGRR